VREIGDTLADIFAQADREGLSTSVVADRVAEAKFKH
jgi:leucine dehydrogenase